MADKHRPVSAAPHVGRQLIPFEHLGPGTAIRLRLGQDHAVGLGQQAVDALGPAAHREGPAVILRLLVEHVGGDEHILLLFLMDLVEQLFLRVVGALEQQVFQGGEARLECLVLGLEGNDVLVPEV